MTLTPKSTFSIDGNQIAAQSCVPGLHLVATPLGNLGDISIRALSVLAGVDVVLCEDTRITSRLMQRYAITTRLRHYHDHNAASVRPAVLQDLKAGKAIALVSDAGMPMVNDPGYKLVRDCVEQGIAVDVVPGPTAPITALALSGLPSDRFLFAGFLSARAGARTQQLEELSDIPATLVVFESAKRIRASLTAIDTVMKDRPVAVAREMTKLHQEVLRGSASEILDSLAERSDLKGEITIVIGPASRADGISDAMLEDSLSELLKDMPASKAATQLALRTGRPRSEIYSLALTLKGREQ